LSYFWSYPNTADTHLSGKGFNHRLVSHFVQSFQQKPKKDMYFFIILLISSSKWHHRYLPHCPSCTKYPYILQTC
jgi:hypothetical protein